MTTNRYSALMTSVLFGKFVVAVRADNKAAASKMLAATYPGMTVVSLNG
jgi:hypothetical protein